ncbi:hypothetical protein GQR58_000967 [Nymphon striatum]|nr:hypothetical protein GQR58_000967 [Nymphon striatum]
MAWSKNNSIQQYSKAESTSLCTSVCIGVKLTLHIFTPKTISELNLDNSMETAAYMEFRKYLYWVDSQLLLNYGARYVPVIMKRGDSQTLLQLIAVPIEIAMHSHTHGHSLCRELLNVICVLTSGAEFIRIMEARLQIYILTLCNECLRNVDTLNRGELLKYRARMVMVVYFNISIHVKILRLYIDCSANKVAYGYIFMLFHQDGFWYNPVCKITHVVDLVYSASTHSPSRIGMVCITSVFLTASNRKLENINHTLSISDVITEHSTNITTTDVSISRQRCSERFNQKELEYKNEIKRLTEQLSTLKEQLKTSSSNCRDKHCGQEEKNLSSTEEISTGQDKTRVYYRFTSDFIYGENFSADKNLRFHLGGGGLIEKDIKQSIKTALNTLNSDRKERYLELITFLMESTDMTPLLGLITN